MNSLTYNFWKICWPAGRWPSRAEWSGAIKIAAVASIVLGLAFAAALALALPELPGFSEMVFAFALGAGAGVSIFALLAIALICRKLIGGRLTIHQAAFQKYGSLAIALCLGYLLACLRYGTADVWARVALGLILLCLLGKAVAGLISGFADQPPGSSGGGWEPPPAPVPRPPGGRPPALSAAAELPRGEHISSTP